MQNRANKKNFMKVTQAPQLGHGIQQNSSVRVLKKLEEKNKLLAVIVTFVNGVTYDHLFTSVEQQAEEGTQVLVYSANSSAVGNILKGFH